MVSHQHVPIIRKVPTVSGCSPGRALDRVADAAQALFSRPVVRLLVPAAFFAALIFLVGLYGVDLFVWDEWVMWDRLFQALAKRPFPLSVLWEQQNEQRNLSTRLIGLLNLELFSGARCVEYGVNVALGGVNCFLAARLLGRTRTRLGLEGGLWIVPVLAAASFSPAQWQIYTWGCNNSILVPLACLLAALEVAQSGLGAGRTIALCIGLGTAGSFHNAAGLFFWIALPISLFPALSGRRATLYRLCFAAAGALAFCLYFWGYSSPPHHPSTLYALRHPLDGGGYFFALLAAPILSDRNLWPAALLIGATGTVYLGLVLYEIHRRRLWAELAPWLALATYSLLAVAATAASRAGFGLRHAFQSRYIPITLLFWIALAALALAAPPRRPRLGKALALVCVGGVCLSYVLFVIALRNIHTELAQAAVEMRRFVDDAPFRLVFPDPAALKDFAPGFFARRLPPYRNVPVAAPPLDRSAPGPGSFGIAASSDLLIEGIRDRHSTFSGMLLLLEDGRVAFAGPTAAETAPDGRFSLRVPAGFLTPGERTYTVVALDSSNAPSRLAAPLAPQDGFRLAAPSREGRFRPLDAWFHAPERR